MSEEDVSGNAKSTPSTSQEKSAGGVTGKGFKPGQSGNVHGPPKWVKEAKEGLRTCLPDTVARLHRNVLEGSDKDSNAAAKIILEYTVRKPVQRHDVSGQLSNTLGEVSTEDLQAFIKAAKGEGK